MAEIVTKENLNELYSNQKLSYKQIGEKLSISPTTVGRLLKKHGVLARKFGEGRLPKDFQKPSKEELNILYWQNYLPISKIAKNYGVDENTIKSFIDQYGIPYRPISQARLPKGIVKPTKEDLERMYLQGKKTTTQIAKLLNVSKKTILNWMKKYDIKRRDSKTAKFEITGTVLPTKEQLEQVYNMLSLDGMSKKYKVSVQAVLTLLKKHSIKRRSRSEARKLALTLNRTAPWNKGLSSDEPRVAKLMKNLHEKHMAKLDQARIKLSITQRKQYAEGSRKVWNKGLTKNKDSRIMKSAERLRNLRLGKEPWNKIIVPLKETLEQKYVIKGMSLSEISTEFNTNQNTVQRWLKSYGIQRRLSHSKVRGKVVGKDGHLLDSSYERAVCDWLSEHKINHDCHGFYAKGKRNFKYDFKIDDYTFIEVKGYMGNSKFSQVYLSKERKKEIWFSGPYFKDSGKHNITLFDIQPDKNGKLSKERISKFLAALLYYKARI